LSLLIHDYLGVKKQSLSTTSYRRAAAKKYLYFSIDLYKLAYLPKNGDCGFNLLHTKGQIRKCQMDENYAKSNRQFFFGEKCPPF